MIVGKAYEAIVKEDIRHALKSAELWGHYAEVGEFKEGGKKGVLGMAQHFRETAEKRKARLQGMPTLANPLGKPDTEFAEAESERQALIADFKVKDKDA